MNSLKIIISFLLFLTISLVKTSPQIEEITDFNYQKISKGYWFLKLYLFINKSEGDQCSRFDNN